MTDWTKENIALAAAGPTLTCERAMSTRAALDDIEERWKQCGERGDEWKDVHELDFALRLFIHAGDWVETAARRVECWKAECRVSKE